MTVPNKLLLAGAGIAITITSSAWTDQSYPELAAPLPMAWAEVTLPYDQWISLWEANQLAGEEGKNARQAKPPVDTVLVSAEYHLQLAEDRAEMEADYRLHSMVDTWQMVPLLGGDVRLESNESEGMVVLWHAGRYQLLLNRTGEFQLSLRFALPSPDRWIGDRGLLMAPGTASLNRLRISGVPEGMSCQILGMAPIQSDANSATYYLPSENDELSLVLEPDSSLIPITPSSWDMQSQVLVRYQEGRLEYHCRSLCHAANGSGLSIELAIPQNASALDFQGDDIASGQLGPRENGQRTLRIDWKTRDILEREVSLTYQIHQSRWSSEWTLHAPRLQPDQESQTFFVVQPVNGLQFVGGGLKDSEHSRRLPSWVQREIGLSDFLTVEGGPEIAVQTLWLPQVETAPAIVRHAEYQSRLVADGALFVQARYDIHHQSPLNWRLRLPTVDQILTCEINQESVRPLKRGEREIEFPISRSDLGMSSVAFSYVARLAALDAVTGSIEIELPETDLFINALNWQLVIPAGYRATAIEGNVTVAANPHEAKEPEGRGERLLQLESQLLRGDPPQVQVYYERQHLIKASDLP